LSNILAFFKKNLILDCILWETICLQNEDIGVLVLTHKHVRKHIKEPIALCCFVSEAAKGNAHWNCFDSEATKIIPEKYDLFFIEFIKKILE